MAHISEDTIKPSMVSISDYSECIGSIDSTSKLEVDAIVGQLTNNEDRSISNVEKNGLRHIQDTNESTRIITQTIREFRITRDADDDVIYSNQRNVIDI